MTSTKHIGLIRRSNRNVVARERHTDRKREREGERAREREEATTIKQQYETKQQSKVEIVGKKIKEIGMKRRRRRIQREK